MKASQMTTRTSRLLRALVLGVVATSVLAVGALPTCAGGLCCPVATDVPAVHTQMPCCDGPSYAPRQAARVQPATFAGLFESSNAPAPVDVVAQPAPFPSIPPRVQATLTTVSDAHHEPLPPLFLLNAQFLI